MLTPILAPRANAIAEGVTGTLRRECLDRLIIVNQWHLWRVLQEFARYYNGDRPEQGPIRSGRILGGLHHVYERAS